mgnify:CR=1 FL=1
MLGVPGHPLVDHGCCPYENAGCGCGKLCNPLNWSGGYGGARAGAKGVVVGNGSEPVHGVCCAGRHAGTVGSTELKL